MDNLEELPKQDYHVSGLKASKTLKQRYGKDYYKKMGAQGGAVSRGGGFTGNPEAARVAGSKGGTIAASRVTREEYQRRSAKAQETLRARKEAIS